MRRYIYKFIALFREPEYGIANEKIRNIFIMGYY